MPHNENNGYVYILTNPAMPGLVKIGMTGRENLDVRLRELYSTGVPVPFQCAFAAKVRKNDCARIERALHVAFAPYRINENREFFRINPEQAIAILILFHHEDATTEVTDEINNDLTEEDIVAQSRTLARRPSLDFYEMGLKQGDVLAWKDNPSIYVNIVSKRKVLYNDEEFSLSALSAQLKGYHNTKHIAPGSHWLYNGRLLSEIYDETYPVED